MAKSNDTDLKDILDDIACGKIQLPEFQRSWTWDDNRIRGIVASVSLGYPMGAIMALEYGNPDIVIKYRPIEGSIPPMPKNASAFSFNPVKKVGNLLASPIFLFWMVNNVLHQYFKQCTRKIL